MTRIFHENMGNHAMQIPELQHYLVIFSENSCLDKGLTCKAMKSFQRRYNKDLLMNEAHKHLLL